MKIWKFGLPPTPRTIIDMPAGAQILSVAEQKGSIVLWALVDQTAKRAPYTVACYLTGDSVPEDPGKHIGTVQVIGSDGHPFVTHYFIED